MSRHRIMGYVIANQCAHWCGNPPQWQQCLNTMGIATSGDALLAMTGFSSGVLVNHRSHLFKLLFHIGHQLELGPAAVQVLLRVVDAEIVVAV